MTRAKKTTFQINYVRKEHSEIYIYTVLLFFYADETDGSMAGLRQEERLQKATKKGRG